MLFRQWGDLNRHCTCVKFDGSVVRLFSYSPWCFVCEPRLTSLERRIRVLVDRCALQSERKKRQHRLPLFIPSGCTHVTRSVALLLLVLQLQWQLQVFFFDVYLLVFFLVGLAMIEGMQNEKDSWRPPVWTFVTNFVKVCRMFQNLELVGCDTWQQYIKDTHFTW